MSGISETSFDPKNHEFRPSPLGGSRSPCPALNAIANHGYVSRGGSNLTFSEIVDALVLVYNLSYPLACILTLAGFATCGHFSFEKRNKLSHDIDNKGSWIQLLFSPLIFLYTILSSFTPRFVLDLSSLSHRGNFKIAHDASFVHPNGVPSTTPSPTLVKSLVEYASTRHEMDGKPRDGLGLIDIAHFHSQRALSAPVALNNIHTQIALGECALTWEVLRGHQCWNNLEEHNRRACWAQGPVDGVIPTSRLEQWFGEERLPEGWWDFEGVRPSNTIGLIRTRGTANFIGTLSRKSSHAKH